MKCHRHTPEQIVRKLREGDRLLNEGKDLTAVLRHLAVSESSWNQLGLVESSLVSQPWRL
jgi:hypothetical protein